MARSARLPLAVLSTALLACDGGGGGPAQVRENAFVWHDRVPAGATVTIREFRGSIDVTPSPDDTVRIVARLEWRGGDPDREVRFSASQVGDDALVCAVWGRGVCSAADYDAKVEGRAATRMAVHFTAQVPAGVKLDLLSISGDITAAASAPVIAKTVDGDVRVVTAVGPVRGESMNGSVDVRMSSLVGGDSVIAKTLNGNAYVYLPASPDAVLDVGVMNGRASTDFPATVEDNGRRLRATLGAGGRVVYARSLNGEVAVRRLDAEGRASP